MEVKEMFMVGFLILGAIFALYGIFLGAAGAGKIAFDFGAAILIGVAMVFGVKIQTQLAELQSELMKLKKE